MTHPLAISCLAALLNLLPSLVWALPEDRNQPINIESDRAQMDEDKRLTRYYGNAILTQGTLKIEGDVITFYYNDSNQIIKMVAEGKPARYKQLQDPTKKPVRARALQMEYHAQSQIIYLLEQGYVWDNGDTMSGSRIEYDTHNNEVIANSAADKIGDERQKDSRVRMVIQPNNNRKEAPPTVSITPHATALSRINIRTGAGKQYTKVGTIAKGSRLTILNEQGDWLQTQATVNGKTMIGWVARALVEMPHRE